MNGEAAISIGLLIALIGCFVGLSGWLLNRDKRVVGDAEWRGQINAKLDVIAGIRGDVDRLDKELTD